MKAEVKTLKASYLSFIAIPIIVSIYLSIIISDIPLPVIFSLIYISIAGFIVLENYRRKKIIELLNPVIFYALLWLIPFGIIPLVIYLGIVDPSTILMSSYKFIDHIPSAQLQAIIGILFLYLGFKFKVGLFPIQQSDKTKIKEPWHPFFVYLSVLFLLILSGLFIIDMIKKGTFFFGVTDFMSEEESGPISYLCALFGIVRGSSLYLFAPFLIVTIGYARFKTRLMKILWILLLISYISLSLISSQKEIMVANLLVLFYYFYYLKGSINRKKEFLFIIVILLFILILPFLNAYRTAVRLGYMPQSISDVKENFNKMLELTDFERDFSFIFVRFDHLNTHLAITAQTPDPIDYKLGATYLKGFLSFLSGLPKMPKDMDIVGFNNLFAREYGIIEPYDIYTAITLPQVSEIYMNFGFFAIPVIMFFYGILYRNIYDFMTQSHNSNLNLIGFILFYIFVIQSSALSFSSSMFQLGRIMIGLSTVMFILNLKRILKYVV